ncbi:hypothetical protein V6N13_007902 [Hibiscus sabdariffa]
MEIRDFSAPAFPINCPLFLLQTRKCVPKATLRAAVATMRKPNTHQKTNRIKNSEFVPSNVSEKPQIEVVCG